MTKRRMTESEWRAARLDAETRATVALGNANDAEEAGRRASAEKWTRKAQFWLDRLNNLEGNGPEGSAPRRNPARRRR